MELLERITELSHEFGTTGYIRGGGGNTSVKDENTLWVKASGTSLAGLTPESMVKMDRKKLAALNRTQTPSDPVDRESLVKEVMMASRLPQSTARPSVEAPLHNCISARYVVHTHPEIVNGMTCSVNAEDACKKLFPDALWLDYIDPGYTLCMEVRRQIQNYKKQNQTEPAIILLKNHGVFVSADTPEEIRTLYKRIMDTLTDEYKKAGISLELPIEPVTDPKQQEDFKKQIQDNLGTDAAFVSSSGTFDIANGPISPDHLVYARSYPLLEEPTAKNIKKYIDKNGCKPWVIAYNQYVFGVGATEKRASLALEMAQDGALIKQFAEAFGGIEYMTDRAREFIENWEVESYRSKQI